MSSVITAQNLSPLAATEPSPGVLTPAGVPAEFEPYRRERIRNWDTVGRSLERNRVWLGGYYHRRLEQLYRYAIPENVTVLELGCGDGSLLAAMKPSVGVGIDFSPAMLVNARKRFPNLTFIEADAHKLPLPEDQKFDCIILSDLLNDLWDVQTVFAELRRFTKPDTRIVMNFYSQVWEKPLAFAQRLGMSRPRLLQNWLTVEDVANLLNLSGFEEVRHQSEILMPLGVPLIAPLCNRFLAKLAPFRFFDMTNVLVARPKAESRPNPLPRVSVVVPARNESGNIAEIFRRVPEMGGGTELIFVEGHSKDDTYAAIEREIKAHPERCSLLFRQTGKGKGDAVRLGYAHATGEILMILDADLTVRPEDLPRFYDAIVNDHGEFINGVRLVYPMEDQAMRFLNLLGNKFFSYLFSWLTGQRFKDTLCGTKVLWARDYKRIAQNRAYFGDFDPFGDFDLLFGAAKANLKMVDLPIRYGERKYGTTNIERWKHGLLLLRMCFFAARRIKFI